MPAIEERTVSAADVEAGGGPPAARLREVMEAYGLPTPGPHEPAFTPEEARVFTELWKLNDIWPQELMVQVSRVHGRLLQRIAQTELQLFRVYAEPRIREKAADPLVGLREVQAAFERLVPLADPLIVGVHRRWLEHELAQIAIRTAESGAGERDLPGGVEVSFLFCDLKDFTAFASEEGDAAAVMAIDRFADTVAQERGPEFRFMKALGDGFMLSYAEPAPAVAAGSRIVDGMRESELPGVHASVHHGVAILREGDYFGGAVNLAARLLGAAGRDELVATRPVVEQADDHPWEAAGTVRVRGVGEPVEVFRLGSA
jgi:adenylate cyclase